MIQLYDYQEKLVADIRSSLAAHRKTVAVSPTGSGKTVTFSYIAARTRERGKRIGIFAHRKELIDQISGTLKEFNVPHGLITAGARILPGQLVYVCSAPTYARRAGLPGTPKFDLIIVDEAHHATDGSTWGQCLSANPDALWLGVTATPERLDGRGLGELFNDMVLGPTTRELIQRGRLSRYRLFAPSDLDLSAVHTLAGDFNRGELAEAVDKPSVTGDAVRHYREHLRGAPSVAFCVSVAHAEHVAEEFRAAGFTSASIDGGMDSAERARRIRDFKVGQVNVLTSCDLISEGFDVPGIHGAILLRPTQSLALYLQQVGRALRTAKGKSEAVILDHAGNVRLHGLPDHDRDWSLDSVARKKRKMESLPVRECLRCRQAMPAGTPQCPGCGFVFPRVEREIEKREGELAEVDTASILAANPKMERRREQGMAKSLEQLMALGHSEARARHIIAAREKKESLRDTLRDVCRQAGVRMSEREIRELKPKQLQQEINRVVLAIGEQRVAI